MHQPYRAQQGVGREASPVLQAMLRGATFYGFNPQDPQRLMQRRSRLALLMSRSVGTLPR